MALTEFQSTVFGLLASEHGAQSRRIDRLQKMRRALELARVPLGAVTTTWPAHEHLAATLERLIPIEENAIEVGARCIRELEELATVREPEAELCAS